MTIKVEIWLVDGGYREWTEPLGILATHDKLVHQGLQGKQLIHKLLTDDWGPPPVRVKLSGSGSNGELVKINIPYR